MVRIGTEPPLSPPRRFLCPSSSSQSRWLFMLAIMNQSIRFPKLRRLKRIAQTSFRSWKVKREHLSIMLGDTGRIPLERLCRLKPEALTPKIESAGLGGRAGVGRTSEVTAARRKCSKESWTRWTSDARSCRGRAPSPRSDGIRPSRAPPRLDFESEFHTHRICDLE